MQNLINELIQPSTDSAGNIIAPSMVKRRAAEALQSLVEQHQNDLQARLKLQAENAELIARYYGPSLEYAKEEYNLVFNKEQEHAFY